MEEQINLSSEQNQEEQPVMHSVLGSCKELPMDNIIGDPLKKLLKNRENWQIAQKNSTKK